MLAGERWRPGIERAQPLELGSKKVITFNNGFLQRAAWWKELQQKSDELFSSSGKLFPGLAQFPKMREKMKSYLLFVFRLKVVRLSGEATKKAGKASAMREGLLGNIVYHLLEGIVRPPT